MQIALQILDELRQFSALSGFDLTASFAQLRRYPRKIDGLVHRVFGVPGNAHGFAKDTVLVDLEAKLLAHAADGDVVRFGAGEVHHRSAETFLSHATQIDLQAWIDEHARSRRSLR